MLRNKFNMEDDILAADWLRQKIRTDTAYAQDFYAGLCNNIFHKRDAEVDELCSFSWRHAGDIVAIVRQQGDYLDWHCSGIVSGNTKEGCIKPAVHEDCKKLGWDVWTDIVKRQMELDEQDDEQDVD